MWIPKTSTKICLEIYGFKTIRCISHIHKFQVHNQSVSRSEILEWTDKTSYAFQRWYTATDQPRDVTKIFFEVMHTRLSLHLSSIFSPSLIQPESSFDRQCTAILAQFAVDLEWIKIPCDKDMERAYFVCEVKIHNTTKGSAMMKHYFINLPYDGCPAGTLGLNSSCLRVFSLPSGDIMHMGDVCKVENMDMFQLPRHFDQGKKLYWSKEQEYFMELLAQMAHRWPSIAGQNGELSDQIILSPPSNDTRRKISISEMLAIQYSDMEFSHVNVTAMSEVVADAFMYVIVCSQLMTVIGRNCLPGHSACHDKTCILDHYFCDGIEDCPDYSDEKECDHVCYNVENSSITVNCFTCCFAPACLCHDLYFQCTPGRCIPWSRVCNGVNDCEQGEDEAFSVCFILNDKESTALSPQNDTVSVSDIYSCLDGPNIPSAYRNDLVPDCPKQDDEQTFKEFLQNGSRMDYFLDESLSRTG